MRGLAVVQEEMEQQMAAFITGLEDATGGLVEVHAHTVHWGSFGVLRMVCEMQGGCRSRPLGRRIIRRREVAWSSVGVVAAGGGTRTV